MSLIKEEKTIKDSLSDNFDNRTSVQIFDIIGLIETTDTAPTDKPVKFSKQIRIYKNGATKRLYWYDSKNQEWSYVTGI